MKSCFILFGTLDGLLVVNNLKKKNEPYVCLKDLWSRQLLLQKLKDFDASFCRHLICFSHVGLGGLKNCHTLTLVACDTYSDQLHQ